jgi:L-fucono-1,5-lactonase
MRIDSHQHFWRYTPAEYSWIDGPLRPLQRDFLPGDLRREMQKTSVEGAVSVEARGSTEETNRLLAVAQEHSFVRGVVGWVPLTSHDVESTLEQLSTDEHLKGLRYSIQSEPDEMFVSRGDFNSGIALLHRFNLAFDILIFAKHLPQTIRFVDRHPRQVFILDHIAKPRIRENVLEPWRTHLQELARRQNVYCKLSGLVTEAHFTGWTEEQLKPYLGTVLEAFGPKRLMFGSDWPVCTVAATYERWFGIVNRWVGRLSPPEREEIFGGTATRAYRLE